MSAWRALEEVSGLALAAMDWRRSYGLNLAALGRYLRPTNDLAESLDCPATTGGLHTVVHHGPGDIVGVCDHCPTEKLSKADIVIQRLDVQSLCKDIANSSRILVHGMVFTSAAGAIRSNSKAPHSI
jgi:hypothetical protein